jgi:hypothetical protein
MLAPLGLLRTIDHQRPKVDGGRIGTRHRPPTRRRAQNAAAWPSANRQMK